MSNLDNEPLWNTFFINKRLIYLFKNWLAYALTVSKKPDSPFLKVTTSIPTTSIKLLGAENPIRESKSSKREKPERTFQFQIFLLLQFIM